MREIKFRAWDKTQNRMRIVSGPRLLRRLDRLGSDLSICDGYIDMGDYLEIPEDVVLMQFTGLLDKNGKEIYEGDVIIVMTTKGEERAVVFFGKYSWCLEWTDHTGDDLSAVGEDVIEVIGNIYENPEMVRG